MQIVKTDLPEYLVRIALNKGHMYTDSVTAKELDRLFNEYTKEELWEFARYEGNDYVEVEVTCGTTCTHTFMRKKDLTGEIVKKYER